MSSVQTDRRRIHTGKEEGKQKTSCDLLGSGSSDEEADKGKPKSVEILHGNEYHNNFIDKRTKPSG